MMSFLNSSGRRASLFAWFAAIALTGCGTTTGPASIAGGLLDTFQADTRGKYEISGTTEAAPDEYGAIRSGDAAVIHFMPGQGLYAETKDNDSVVIARAVAPMKSGSVILKFKPLVVYPAHGRITVMMDETGQNSGYSMDISGGNYEDVLLKRADGKEVARQSGFGPYFTTLHKLGEYDGEMETSWKIPDPVEHTVELKFTPGSAECIYDGQTIRTISDAEGAPVACDKLSIRFFQLECMITGLEIRSGEK